MVRSVARGLEERSIRSTLHNKIHARRLITKVSRRSAHSHEAAANRPLHCLAVRERELNL